MLLNLWPHIREKAPEAELHVFYGFNTLDAVARQNPQLADFKRALLAQVAGMGGESAGIFLRGRVGQVQLAEEMGNARVWTYPTAFLETSCIGAMEARAAGLPIVTSELGALSETVGEHGQLIPWEGPEDEAWNATGQYGHAFVEKVAKLLTDKETWESWHAFASANCAENDWPERVKDWEALIPEKPAELSGMPLSITYSGPPSGNSANITNIVMTTKG